MHFCYRERELQIHNSDGQQQATLLREDLPGFIFESNRGTKHSFTAETSLGNFLAFLNLFYVMYNLQFFRTRNRRRLGWWYSEKSCRFQY